MQKNIRKKQALALKEAKSIDKAVSDIAHVWSKLKLERPNLPTFPNGVVRILFTGVKRCGKSSLLNRLLSKFMKLNKLLEVAPVDQCILTACIWKIRGGKKNVFRMYSSTQKLILEEELPVEEKIGSYLKEKMKQIRKGKWKDVAQAVVEIDRKELSGYEFVDTPGLTESKFMDKMVFKELETCDMVVFSCDASHNSDVKDGLCQPDIDGLKLIRNCMGDGLNRVLLVLTNIDIFLGDVQSQFSHDKTEQKNPKERLSRFRDKLLEKLTSYNEREPMSRLPTFLPENLYFVCSHRENSGMTAMLRIFKGQIESWKSKGMTIDDPSLQKQMKMLEISEQYEELYESLADKFCTRMKRLCADKWLKQPVLEFCTPLIYRLKMIHRDFSCRLLDFKELEQRRHRTYEAASSLRLSLASSLHSSLTSTFTDPSPFRQSCIKEPFSSVPACEAMERFLSADVAELRVYGLNVMGRRMQQAITDHLVLEFTKRLKLLMDEIEREYSGEGGVPVAAQIDANYEFGESFRTVGAFFAGFLPGALSLPVLWIYGTAFGASFGSALGPVGTVVGAVSGFIGGIVTSQVLAFGGAALTGGAREKLEELLNLPSFDNSEEWRGKAFDKIWAECFDVDGVVESCVEMFRNQTEKIMESLRTEQQMSKVMKEVALQMHPRFFLFFFFIYYSEAREVCAMVPEIVFRLLVLRSRCVRTFKLDRGPQIGIGAFGKVYVDLSDSSHCFKEMSFSFGMKNHVRGTKRRKYWKIVRETFAMALTPKDSDYCVPLIDVVFEPEERGEKEDEEEDEYYEEDTPSQSSSEDENHNNQNNEKRRKGEEKIGNIIRIIMPRYHCSLYDYFFQKRTKVEWKKKLGWFYDICLGLRFFHNELKIIHRDLRPANVFLSGESHEHSVIGDLGLSNLLTNRPASDCGSCPFVDRQVRLLRRQGYGREVDMHSLGVLFAVIWNESYDVLREEYADTDLTADEMRNMIEEEEKVLKELKKEEGMKGFEELEKCVIKCTHLDYFKRPVIKQVIATVEKILKQNEFDLENFVNRGKKKKSVGEKDEKKKKKKEKGKEKDKK